MGESWDEHAETWDDGAPAQYADAAARSLRERVGSLGKTLTGARVLDFGAGTGLLSERLAPDVGSIVALDPSAAMVAKLRAKIVGGLEGVEAVEGMLDDAVLATAAFAQPFDLVLASSVCAFLDDYPGTLGRLASLLRPGGLFVQWDWEWQATDEDPFGLTREQMEEAIRGAGLEVAYVGRGFEERTGEMTMAPLMGVGIRHGS